MKCPICDYEASNKKGLATHFRHQKETHPPYNFWFEEERWKDKKEGEDFVICLICNQRHETLARHLKAEHGFTSEKYKKKFGENVPIRANKVTENMSEASKNRQDNFGKEKPN